MIAIYIYIYIYAYGFMYVMQVDDNIQEVHYELSLKMEVSSIC